MNKMTVESGETKAGLAPKLRFPEFRDEPGWKSTRLGLMLRFQPGFPFPSAGFNDSKVGLRLIRNRDLRSDDGIVYFSGNFDASYVVSNGDVLVGMDGDFTPTVWNRGEALLNQRVGRVEALEGNARTFLLYLLTLTLKEIEEATARTTVKHLSHSAVEERHELAPLFPEQQKIAECLGSLDELIGAEHEKLDALKAYKKGLMQQLFPREGETVPRLRFPEFRGSGGWEVKALASEIDLISGMHLSPEQYGTTGEIPYFTGPSDFTNEIQEVTKWTNPSANVAKPEDTLITVKGSGVGELWYSTLPAVAIGRQLMAVRTKHGSSRYIFQFLLTKRTRFEDLGSGNLIPGISRSDILELEALFPSPAEQHRIADLLSSLDGVASVQATRVEALQAHKQALMQQLFPSSAKAPMKTDSLQ